MTHIILYLICWHLINIKRLSIIITKRGEKWLFDIFTFNYQIIIFNSWKINKQINSKWYDSSCDLVYLGQLEPEIYLLRKTIDIPMANHSHPPLHPFLRPPTTVKGIRERIITIKPFIISINEINNFHSFALSKAGMWDKMQGGFTVVSHANSQVIFIYLLGHFL